MTTTVSVADAPAGEGDGLVELKPLATLSGAAAQGVGEFVSGPCRP